MFESFGKASVFKTFALDWTWALYVDTKGLPRRHMCFHRDSHSFNSRFTHSHASTRRMDESWLKTLKKDFMVSTPGAQHVAIWYMMCGPWSSAVVVGSGGWYSTFLGGANKLKSSEKY